jgi:transketolase
MTQKALSIVLSSDKNLGLVDLIKLKGYSEAALLEKIKEYNKIITIEEGFIGKGGVDSLVNNLVVKYELHKKVINMGLQDNYIFHIGSREHLHGKHKVDEKAIKEVIDKI